MEDLSSLFLLQLLLLFPCDHSNPNQITRHVEAQAPKFSKLQAKILEKEA